MSRIGKTPIPFPPEVSITVDPEERKVVVRGPRGELSRSYRHEVVVVVDEDAREARVFPAEGARGHIVRALWGTTAAHLKNMVRGVTEGFCKVLEVHGIGYRAELSGSALTLHVGYSHPVVVPIPQGLEVVVEKNTITVRGADKELVGQFAANVRKVRKPEPYKGKGIRYQGEYIRMKEGKKK